MTSWGFHRRGPGASLALHSSATHVGLLHASLAASGAPQAVPVAGLLLPRAGCSSLPWGNKRDKGKGKVLSQQQVLWGTKPVKAQDPSVCSWGVSELMERQAMGRSSLGPRDCLGTTVQSREDVQPTSAAWAVQTKPWRGQGI